MTSLVEEFYGLERAPFTFEPGRGPVLMTESLRNAASFLRTGLAEHAPILTVLGGAGIGKSSLARALPKIVGEEWKIAKVSGHSKSWEDFGPTLAREFHVHPQRITREELEAAHERVGKPLIVVDDAQYLSPLLLERICILPQLLTTFGEPVAQVILLADLDSVRIEHVRPLLAWVDADARYEMEPVPVGDAHRFIDTCLRRAGWEGQPLVCEAGASAIHRFSLGNPRRIGEASMDVLERAATRGLKLIDAEFVVECLSATRTHLLGEPLMVAPGTPICEEPQLDLVECKDDFPFATIPLTAENINQSESLQLEDEELEAAYKVLGYPTAGGMSTMTDAINSTARSASSARPPTLRKKHRAKGHSSMAVWACAIIAVVVLYSARTEVAQLLQQIGLNLPFSAQAVGAVESPKTLQEALSLSAEPAATQVTVPVPNEPTDSELAASPAAQGVVDESDLASN